MWCHQAAEITVFFEMREVAELKWLKHVIIEEKKISRALSGRYHSPRTTCSPDHSVELLKGDHEKNYEKLSRAVASADEIGLHSPEAEEARQVVAFIKEK